MAPLTQAKLLRMKKLIYSFFTFFLISIVYGQQISGNVSDQNGQPLPGVNILSAANKTAVSDFDGNFTIEATAGQELTFTMVGFTTKKAKAAASMKVALAEEVNLLNEVVAIGYGTKKSGTITGSVSRIKTEDILKTPAQSAIQAIQGKSAGVNIVTNDEPGANPSIRIRGLGTILGGRDPLYVIDGIESSTISNLNPNDIATIDILKDASSIAIYGQKGANGVVIVTTKKGKKGELKVSYNSYYGQKEILGDVEMADSYKFAYYNNYALGSSSYFNFNQPYNTNWLDEITRKGEVMNNSVSISGATESTNYYFGVSHYTEKGILLGTDFKKTNILNKNEYKIADDRLKINHMINLSIIDNTPKPLSAFTNAYKQSPIVPVRYSNGRWGVPLVNRGNGLNDLVVGGNYDKYNNVGNPVAQLYNTYEKNKNLNLAASIAAELKLMKDLTITSSFGATADWGKGYTFTPLTDIYLTQNPFDTYEDYVETFGDKPVLKNKLQQRRTDSYNWNWDNYLTYKKEFGKHDITVVAGISRTTSNNSEYLNATRFNLPAQTNYWYLDFSDYNINTAPLEVVNNEHETPRVSLAYFARAEYAFMEKYMLTAIVRREGISAFQGEKKWAVFPSISAGWVISNENFLKNSTFINNLKLRGGYGEVGNGNGPTYNNVAFSGKKNYSFGVSSLINPGSYVANAVDPNLTWETMKEFDFGLDFSILKNRLSGSIDYYDRKSEDIILEITPPDVISELPTYINSGAVSNKGYEVSLRWEDRINDNLNYWIGGNFSSNKNEVTRSDSPYFLNFPGSGDLGNGQNTKRVVVGQPLGSFYVFDQTGYSNDGTPVYRDVDGDGVLTDADRINAGSYIPDFTYGINLGVNYKNIDLSIDAYGVGGSKVYNGKKAQRFGGENVENDVLENFWTPSNPNAVNPKPFNETPRASTYYVENGDFLRINNITLGYTFPKMFEKLDKVRLYLTAVNPFIFTNYSGYSPEIVGGDNANPLRTAGIELDAYPTNKTFLVGVNVGF